VYYWDDKMSKRNTCMVLVRNPEGKRPHERFRHRWEDNIRVYLKGTGLENVKWIHYFQNNKQWRTLVNTVVKIWVS
jgi:hypothetical protein